MQQPAADKFLARRFPIQHEIKKLQEELSAFNERIVELENEGHRGHAMEVLKANAMDFARQIDELRSLLVEPATKASKGKLLRFQAERFELSTPLRGSIAEPFDTDAARQTTFDCGLDEVRCEEGKRDSHIDLSDAAFLTCGDLLDVSDRA